MQPEQSLSHGASGLLGCIIQEADTEELEKEEGGEGEGKWSGEGEGGRQGSGFSNASEHQPGHAKQKIQCSC